MSLLSITSTHCSWHSIHKAGNGIDSINGDFQHWHFIHTI